MIARDAKSPNLSSAVPSTKVQSPALLEADLLGKDTDQTILSMIWAVSSRVNTQPLRKGEVPEQHTSKSQGYNG